MPLNIVVESEFGTSADYYTQLRIFEPCDSATVGPATFTSPYTVDLWSTLSAPFLPATVSQDGCGTVEYLVVTEGDETNNSPFSIIDGGFGPEINGTPLPLPYEGQVVLLVTPRIDLGGGTFIDGPTQTVVINVVNPCTN